MTHAKAAILVASLVVLCNAVLAGRALANAKVGFEAVVFSGTHFDSDGNTSATIAYPLGQLVMGSPRYEVALEGFPAIGLPKTHGAYSISTSLGFADGIARAAIDRAGRFWLGAGEMVINQSTPFGCAGERVFGGCQTQQSRASGGRYELVLRTQTRGEHFLEVTIDDMPHLTANVHFLFQNPYLQAVTQPEKGRMLDVAGRFGIRKGQNELSLGIRNINYSAIFLPSGNTADRNVGAGVTLRYMHALGG